MPLIILQVVGITTTVTTTTVTTTAFTFAIGALCTIALLIFLVAKELSAAHGGDQAVRWSRTLNIGILPLLFAFVAIVTERVLAGL